MRILLLTLVLLGVARGQDVIEFLNGSKLDGEVVSIDKAAREVDFTALIGAEQQQKRYPYASIHAVTWKGKRYVVTPKTVVDRKPVDRSAKEVETVIATEGATLPPWLASTELDYPDTLDVTWPLKAEGDWNSQINVGQYLWDRINPNQKRWRSGLKFIHHLHDQHKDEALLQRDERTLGQMYFNLFQDYARAAYWWKKGGVTSSDPESVRLAECYWHLGNKAMAVKFLEEGPSYIGEIKVLGDMGETSKAVKLADLHARNQPHEAYLLGGDALRLAGKFREALAYYQKVLDEKQAARNADYEQRFRARAQESVDAIRFYELFDLAKVPDGEYAAGSRGYEAEVKVRVTVRGKRIEDVQVTEHREKQFYSALTDVPAQIIEKQSVKGVVATSHATITGEAIINATAKAVAQAVK